MPTATYTGTFTTADVTAPVISGISHGTPSASAANIAWNTNEPADSQVEIATNSGMTGSTFSTLNPALVTSRSVNMPGLAASTQYWYRVRSRDASLNLSVSSIQTFTTAATADSTPPVISAITVDIFDTSARIRWTTNEPASSRIDYGLTSARGTLNTLDATLVTSHDMTLTGLTPNTPYHFAVISADAATNSVTSDDQLFITEDNLTAVFGANLLRWYEIARMAAQADGSVIISPTDYGAGTTDLTQTVNADRPVYRINAFGDQGAAEFTTNTEWWRALLAGSTDIALTGDGWWLTQVKSTNRGGQGIAHRAEADSTDGWGLSLGQGSTHATPTADAGKPCFMSSDATARAWHKAPVDVADGDTHTILWTRSGTTLNCYVDRADNLVATFTVVVNTGAATGSGFEVGRFPAGTAPMAGMINLLALGNNVPSATQIERVFDIYNAGA